jgi:hypothetical protein
MATRLKPGVYVWSGDRNKEGYRTFKATFLVESDDANDGPFTVLNTVGLPQEGDQWNFGNDNDQWAWCTPEAKITGHGNQPGEANPVYEVECTFTNYPMKRCQEVQIEDPLLEPMKISGSFSKYTKEATVDYQGSYFMNSAFERIHGPQVEFDANRPSVKIEQNVGNLELPLFSSMVDTVNDSPLWGLPARCIKLSNAPWERKIYGQCYFYYCRTFEFECAYETWDRQIEDEGTKVLNGHWLSSPTQSPEWILDNLGGKPPNPKNPTHFRQFHDISGEAGRVILNGAGLPAYFVTFADRPNRKGQKSYTGTSPASSDSGTINIQYYTESNFLLLGIPVSL